MAREYQSVWERGIIRHNGQQTVVYTESWPQALGAYLWQLVKASGLEAVASMMQHSAWLRFGAEAQEPHNPATCDLIEWSDFAYSYGLTTEALEVETARVKVVIPWALNEAPFWPVIAQIVLGRPVSWQVVEAHYPGLRVVRKWGR